MFYGGVEKDMKQFLNTNMKLRNGKFNSRFLRTCSKL